MSQDNGSVAIISDSMGGVRFWKGLAENTNKRLIVINFVKKNSSIYQNAKIGTSYIDLSEIIDNYEKEDNKLSAIEKTAVLEEMDVNLQEIIYSDRHLGRGYFYFGSRHPRSKLSDIANYKNSLNYIYKLSLEIKNTFVKENVNTVVLTGVASAQTKLVCVIARSLCITVRVLSPARIGNMYYWSTSEFLGLPEASQSISQERVDGSTFDSFIGNYVSVKRNITTVLSKHTLIGTLKDTVAVTKRELRKKIKSIVGVEHKSISEYYSFDQILYPSKRYLDKKIYERLSNKIGGKEELKYFYLPLHLEPEAALMVLSPEINNQLFVIQSISLALPNNVVLVVKENPLAVGKRPAGFYETIAKMPNVLLSGLEEEGFILAKNSIGTVVITGSTAIESLFFDKPVISFGMHNVYNQLPDVYVVKDYYDLTKAIKKCLGYNAGDYSVRKDLVNSFLYTLVNCSVDLGELKLSSYEAGKRMSSILAL